MLSGLHVSSPATSTVARPAIDTRTPRRLLGARTLEELRELLGTVVAGLYQDGARLELYVADGLGRLEPVAQPEAVPSSGARQLLASLRSRFATSGWALTEPRALPALPHVRRGPIVTAPLLDADEELIGLVAVEAPAGAAEYGHLHVAVLEGIGALLSAAVQRLRPGPAARERARVELDRKAARRLQRRLMSGTLPPGIGVTACTEYLPALDVGGDFYSLRYLGDRTVTVAVGDVSGNGVSAALLMSRVASDIERALVAREAPASVLEAVNESLADVESEMFVTATCVRLDTGTRRLTVANAGHLPLVVRRAGGEVFTCGGASGAPLGMLSGTYENEEVALDPGDIVLLMTDGLLEALDHPSGRRGLDVLLALVRAAPHDPRRVHGRIREAVEEARSEHALDDVTWVALQLAD